MLKSSSLLRREFHCTWCRPQAPRPRSQSHQRIQSRTGTRRPPWAAPVWWRGRRQSRPYKQTCPPRLLRTLGGQGWCRNPLEALCTWSHPGLAPRAFVITRTKFWKKFRFLLSVFVGSLLVFVQRQSCKGFSCRFRNKSSPIPPLWHRDQHCQWSSPSKRCISCI